MARQLPSSPLGTPIGSAACEHACKLIQNVTASLRAKAGYQRKHTQDCLSLQRIGPAHSTLHCCMPDQAQQIMRPCHAGSAAQAAIWRQHLLTRWQTCKRCVMQCGAQSAASVARRLPAQLLLPLVALVATLCRAADVVTVSTPRALVEAVRGGAPHVHIVEHLDLRMRRAEHVEDCGANCSVPVLFWAPPTLRSLTVRSAALQSSGGAATSELCLSCTAAQIVCVPLLARAQRCAPGQGEVSLTVHAALPPATAFQCLAC